MVHFFIFKYVSEITNKTIFCLGPQDFKGAAVVFLLRENYCLLGWQVVGTKDHFCCRLVSDLKQWA
jgi:hypothetical protein